MKTDMSSPIISSCMSPSNSPLRKRISEKIRRIAWMMNPQASNIQAV
jgi:hypothetical protein